MQIRNLKPFAGIATRRFLGSLDRRWDTVFASDSIQGTRRVAKEARSSVSTESLPEAIAIGKTSPEGSLRLRAPMLGGPLLGPFRDVELVQGLRQSGPALGGTVAMDDLEGLSHYDGPSCGDGDLGQVPVGARAGTRAPIPASKHLAAGIGDLLRLRCPALIL